MDICQRANYFNKEQEMLLIRWHLNKPHQALQRLESFDSRLSMNTYRVCTSDNLAISYGECISGSVGEITTMSN